MSVLNTEVGKNSRRYWVVTTNYEKGNTKGDKVTVVEVDINDIPATFDVIYEHECGYAQCTFKSTPKNLELLIGYKSANQLNGGCFDNECSDRPCFKVDGYITYLNSVKEITGTEYDVLNKVHPSSKLSFNDINESVAQAFNEHFIDTDPPTEPLELLEPAF